jgi:GNAT superfamily N-acetyltransferase
VDRRLTIRRASADDVETLARIHLAARRSAGDRFPPSVHDDAELVPHLLTDVLPVAEAWLAERGAEPVGVLVLEGDLLDQLYVAPAAQGSGVGSALLEHAKARRPDGLRLWVFVSNDPARAFYAHRGFLPIGGSDGSANEEGSPDLLLGWGP